MKRLLSITFLLITFYAYTQPLSLSPVNPHYFLYKGKPTILITSAEHYGGVLNTAFDYTTYFNILQKNNFNLTRIFVGTQVEGNFIDFDPGKKSTSEENQNTLAPRAGKLIAPWARSDQPGYINGGNKFDLDQWDEKYFSRLKDFCRQAEMRGIIVEIVFFSAQYGPSIWANSPLNAKNNINDVEAIEYNELHLLKNKKLISRQVDMVQKIVQEINQSPNIYFEICNEPYWMKGIPETGSGIKTQQFLPELDEWQQLLSNTIKETEQKLPVHHLIAQNFANTYFKIEKPDENVSIFNFHYAFPPKAVTDNYHFNKPVSFDETSDGQQAPNRRREAWAFIMEGGAVYNNLDWSFTTDDITGLGRNLIGKRQSGKEVREQLAVLVKTINSFDFIHAKPIDSVSKGDLPDGIRCYGLKVEAKDHLLYWMKTKPSVIEKWIYSLPAGNFELKWIDPIDGHLVKKELKSHRGGNMEIKLPAFADDLLLKITVTKS